MIPPKQKEILEKLAAVAARSPDVRFGQLLAQLGFLGEDQFSRTLWDIEDDELLCVIDEHLVDLCRRESRVV